MGQVLRLLIVFLIAGGVLGSALTARGQIIGFEDCWFSRQPPLNVGLGERLAQADRLDAAALGFDQFPYEACFRLGGNCPQFPIEVDERVLDDPRRECRFQYPDSGVADYDSWRAQRGAYNGCMTDILQRKAAEIRSVIFRKGGDLPALDEVLSGDTGELNGDEVTTVSTDVTWCPAEVSSFRVVISCRGGGMVVGTYQGETRLTHRVSQDGALCISDYDGPETCHRLMRDGDALTLEPLHYVLDGPFKTVAGVDGLGRWNQTCEAN